jgi:hypothetical protein
VGKVAQDFRQRLFDFFSSGVISQSASSAQRRNDAALIGFDVEDAQTYAPSGAGSARTESTGRNRRPLSSASLVTRALGILA